MSQGLAAVVRLLAELRSWGQEEADQAWPQKGTADRFCSLSEWIRNVGLSRRDAESEIEGGRCSAVIRKG